MLSNEFNIKDILLIEPKIFKDDRGYFFEAFNQKTFQNLTHLNMPFVQDNQSFSNFGVLRGLHFQTSPHSQGKLVRVLSGKIFDVAVDLRPNSKTFGRWANAILSSEQNNMFWIPRGFAHGFYVLSDFAEILYKTDNFYNTKSEITLKWNDPTINIRWPLGSSTPKLSDKDTSGISFSDFLKHI
jgi:dTDP-4-dehydrorhamnose 3,5-epimerase